ncbi:hypothetical protein IYW40_07185 [Methylocystis sp. H4A]|uniref:hypothetical protein n=1 Tax=Methylocystis sp. H4A TaxID=2785788 RepID=UPI001A33B7A6|nr:hypothetical protein [Methylocystis sp. H4A]MBG0801265.1 hypothetical protein [Methylocystis sp. H4A]
MIDCDDPEMLVELLRQAENLAVLNDTRLERELAAIHERAIAQFIAGGATDIEAFFSADAIAARLRSLVANRRRAHALAGPPGGCNESHANENTRPVGEENIFPCKMKQKR